MNLKCLFGHKWYGCKCPSCGTVRDEQHVWDLCKGKCIRCGAMHPEQHDWNGCKCIRCGKIRDEQHDWNGCKCSRCGKNSHDWEGCKCKKCGETRDSGHKWSDGKCIICDKESSKNIRHISCICYNAPDIKSFVPQIKDYIITAELKRGNKVTSTSRISVDCFYDNANLDNPNVIRQKLEEFYSVYQEKTAPLLDNTVVREIIGQSGCVIGLFDMANKSITDQVGIENCRLLAKCYVLYEQP